jgi:hypothetical protein
MVLSPRRLAPVTSGTNAVHPDGGSGGNGGTQLGDPYMTYSGDDGAEQDTRISPNVTDLVGDGVQLGVGDALGFQISTVSWTVKSTTGNSVYKSQILNPRTGYVNNPFTGGINIPPNPITVYWDGTAGNYTITATVNYVDTAIPPAPVSMSVSTVLPTGFIGGCIVGTPTLTQSGILTTTTTLSSANPSSTTPAGIAYVALVDPTSLPANLYGVFGVIQTINPLAASEIYSGYSAYYTYDLSVANPPGGPQTTPRPVVDDNASSSFYDDSFGAVTSGYSVASATLPLNDTPSISVGSGYISMTFIATFKDTLMFSPGSTTNGFGIDVPLGYKTWSLYMGASVGSSGSWGLVSTPTTFTAYTASTAYPAWSESNNYLWTTYGKWVLMS